MDLRKKTKADHDFIIKMIRKNVEFYKDLNVINTKFDEPMLKDELDWLKSLIDSSFTLIWDDGRQKGLIGTLCAFDKKDVTNDGEEVKVVKVYWYTLPENDSVELTYKSLLENYFKCQVEGVKIDGSLNKKPLPNSGIKSKPRPTNRKAADVSSDLLTTPVHSNGKKA